MSRRAYPASVADSLLMPLADERLVETRPFAIVPRWSRRHAFLAQGVDGHHPVAARGLADLGIGVSRLIDRLGCQTIALLPRAVDARAFHAIDAIAFQLLLGAGLPLQLAIVAVFLREKK